MGKPPKPAVERFAKLPHAVLGSDDCLALSGSAFKALVYIVEHYNGRNNGNLTLTPEQARRAGIKSKTTVTSARRELCDRNLLMVTREPVFLNPGSSPTLYALTWLPINDCEGRHTYPPTDKAPRNFGEEVKTASRYQ